MVIDRFHLVREMNDKQTTLRRQFAREVDESEKELLKGIRWLLVADRNRLEDEKSPREADLVALSPGEIHQQELPHAATANIQKNATGKAGIRKRVTPTY